MRGGTKAAPLGCPSCTTLHAGSVLTPHKPEAALSAHLCSFCGFTPFKLPGINPAESGGTSQHRFRAQLEEQVAGPQGCSLVLPVGGSGVSL